MKGIYVRHIVKHVDKQGNPLPNRAMRRRGFALSRYEFDTAHEGGSVKPRGWRRARKARRRQTRASRRRNR